ncbi:MAG: ribokinase [Actinomycetota bacterium]
MSGSALPGGPEATHVLVVGSANIDLVVTLERAPAAGETVVGEGFATHFGGKGANQAVMARRLGGRVELVGCLGDDVHGRLTRDELGRLGVGLEHVRAVAGEPTGVAQIQVEPDGTNRIVVVPGANARLRPDDAAEAVRDARPAVVVAQFEVPQSAILAAFAAARAVGATTVLNPAPAMRPEPGLLGLTDWLVPNETEFALLSGAPMGSVEDDALVAFARAEALGLVVTLGERGVVLVDLADGAEGSATPQRIGAPVVDAVDTTGAGDAFVGAFAVGLAAGRSAAAAARVAIACAAESVTRPGAQASYPAPPRARELWDVTDV